jgi:hypothetical protein
MKQVGESILQLNIYNPLTITKILKKIHKFRNISLTVVFNSFRSYFDLYSTFTGPYTLKYSFLLVKMKHFFYPLDYTNILRTTFHVLENIFFRPYFALIFNFEDPHSTKYAKSTYSMNQFFVPTHIIFKMGHFRRYWLEKNFRLFSGHYHSLDPNSGSSEPRKSRMVPNESQGSYLQFKFLIHHLRWWI